MQKINVFIQARMSSTRLPKKVLMPVVKRPMLLMQIERVKKIQYTGQLVVITSTDSSDDEIAMLCEDENINCFRGALHNVLDRFYCASKVYPANQYMRLTADCPLFCPDIANELIRMHFEYNYDYTSNIIKRSYPDGMDCEIISQKTLHLLAHAKTTTQEQEHVTLYLKHNPHLFKLGHLIHSPNQSEVRLTVDYHEDYLLISKIYEDLYSKNSNFTFVDITNWLETHNNTGVICE